MQGKSENLLLLSEIDGVFSLPRTIASMDRAAGTKDDPLDVHNIDSLLVIRGKPSNRLIGHHRIMVKGGGSEAIE